MTVSVVIPYRDLGVPERREAFDYVCSYYEEMLPGAEIVVSGDEPFTRARAINRAIEEADGDIIVESDPDSLVPPAQLDEAIRLAVAADGLVVPFQTWLNLAREPTREILYGDADFTRFGPSDCDEFGVGGEGKAVVFSRRTWAIAGGFDERFPMWGGDDSAFAYACDAYFGLFRRIDGYVFHLWHPRLPESSPTHPSYPAQFAILAEYRDASAIGAEAVRAIIERRR